MGGGYGDISRRLLYIGTRFPFSQLLAVIRARRYPTSTPVLHRLEIHVPRVSKSQNVVVVRPEWVMDTWQEGRELPCADYALLPFEGLHITITGLSVGEIPGSRCCHSHVGRLDVLFCSRIFAHRK